MVQWVRRRTYIAQTFKYRQGTELAIILNQHDGNQNVFIVVDSIKSPRLCVWYPIKFPLLAISRSGVMQGFEIVDFIIRCTRMHYEYFTVLNVLPCFLFMLKNTEIIPFVDGDGCT